MKGRTLLLCSALILVALLLLDGYCFGQNYIAKSNEELYGTWTNENAQPQEMVKFPGGYKTYDKISDSNPYEEGTEQIAEKSTDSEGNVWYKTFGTVTFGIHPSGP